jgi:HSP20 family protein
MTSKRPGQPSEGERGDRRGEGARDRGAATGQGPSLARRERHEVEPWTGPFTFLRRMTEEVDRLFEGLGFEQGWPRGGGGLASRGSWSPSVEMFQRGDQLVLRADLPGLTKDDVKVEVQDDELLIQGERRREHEETREGVFRSERSYGSFYRVIPLPEGAAADRAKASFKNGVLEIEIPAPSRPTSQTRRIEIE